MTMKFNLHFFTSALFVGTALAAGSNLTTLHSFTSFADGGYPMTGLTIDSRGALYGGTEIGGNYEACDEGGACGVIFKLTPPSQAGGVWTESELYDFQFQDPYPLGGTLVFAGAKNLYGGAGPGGNGSAIVQLTETNGSWSLNPIYSPASGTPLFGKKNNMFVLGGGTYGSVVELTRSSNETWTATTLYTFLAGNDGNNPQVGVVADYAGNLYGTTLFGGGGTNCGTVYELSPQANGGWTEKILHSFTGGADGCFLTGDGVILDNQGNLFGATITGGNGPCDGGCGVVYELSPPAGPGGAWKETILHTFVNTDGANPQANLTLSSTGVLYGTTELGGGGPCEPTGAGCGTVFRLIPPSAPGGTWAESSFGLNGADGSRPLASVLLNESTGTLYGTTRLGGVYGYGTVFQLVLP
jgi:uncharacterized repeat protein (TIGR03803 family)